MDRRRENRLVPATLEPGRPTEQRLATGERPHAITEVRVEEQSLDERDPRVVVVSDESGYSRLDGGDERLGRRGDRRRPDECRFEPLDRALRLVERHRRERREVDVDVAQDCRKVEPGNEPESSGPWGERRQRRGADGRQPQRRPRIRSRTVTIAGSTRPVEIVGVGAAEVADTQRSIRQGADIRCRPASQEDADAVLEDASTAR